MKVVLLLLFVVALANFVHSGTINAVHEGEYDVIYLDEPAWVHALHINPITQQFYAFGEATFRQINHAQGIFQAVDNLTVNAYNAPYLDVRIFGHDNNLYMIGPTNFQHGKTALNVGFFSPLAFSGPGLFGSYQGRHRGYTFSAVSVDSRNFPLVYAYFVGWAQGPFLHVPPESVALVVVRTHFNYSSTPTHEFDWNRESDIAVLWTDEYRPYHATYRPYIIHDYTANRLIVVDPGTNGIYAVSAPANVSQEIQPIGGRLDISPYGRLSGVNWHYANELLVLGFAPEVGQGNGTLLGIYANSLTVAFRYAFAAWHTNPRAIAGRNTTLYIAFEGGPSIVRFDTTQVKVTGWTRLPEQLWQVYSAWDEGYDHIYFSTWEQHSKVFRLHKNDFCTSDCGYNGWCQAGVCHCPPNTKYNAQANFCEFPQPANNGNNGTNDKGAAIAMGILFALAFIAAVAGWVVVYRKSRGYEKLLG